MEILFRFLFLLEFAHIPDVLCCFFLIFVFALETYVTKCKCDDGWALFLGLLNLHFSYFGHGFLGLYSFLLLACDFLLNICLNAFRNIVID